MSEIRIAVFASGTGSNFRRLHEVSERGELAPGKVVLLVSDQPSCLAVSYARKAHVPVIAHTFKELGGKAAWEAHVVEKLREEGVSLIALAGYMRLVGDTLLSPYKGRMINIHPSYLPEFPGLDAVQQALDAKVPETGVTIHFVDEGLDSGPIIDQRRIQIEPTDTHETLLQKVHAVEHQLFPQVVQRVCTSC